MSLNDLADKIIDRAFEVQKGPSQVGVFRSVKGNSVKIVRVESDSFKKDFERRFRDFIGVYDTFSTREMIVDDLVTMGVTP